jgi:hypothetical protein
MMKFDLRILRPSQELLDFYDKYDSFEDAWNACPRGDWMLWIAGRLEIDRRIFILAKSRYARTVIHLMKDKRSRDAVEVSEQYGLGKATKEELMRADKRAKDAYIAAAVYASADPTDCASAATSSAAYAAATFGYDAFYASFYASSYASFYAVYASSSSATDAVIAKSNNQQQTADICRELLTKEIFNKLKQT